MIYGLLAWIEHEKVNEIVEEVDYVVIVNYGIEFNSWK